MATPVKTRQKAHSAKRAAPPVRARARKTHSPLTLARILRRLRKHLPDLSARYPIKSLGVFGSYARGDYKIKSDVDVLIEFTPGAHLSLFGVVGLENELSDLLGVKVDLTEKQMLRPIILEHVIKDLVSV